MFCKNCGVQLTVEDRFDLDSIEEMIKEIVQRVTY